MKLPSGAELEITLSPFEDAKNLLQVISAEGIELKLDANQEIDVNFFKGIFLKAISSKKIEAALKVCMSRATYNGQKIDKDTFEDPAAREDYLLVCMEVAKENLSPFTKSLSALFGQLFDQAK